MKIKEKG